LSMTTQDIKADKSYCIKCSALHPPVEAMCALQLYSLDVPSSPPVIPSILAAILPLRLMFVQKRLDSAGIGAGFWLGI
ncbi:hypothetical protein, partial [Nostoc sp. DedVER01b]|uniref:hypothetical protein n=1 Tax=Nostoc sp. DedVER01b TaxID=3075404 RepID=UPI002AD2A0A9